MSVKLSATFDSLSSRDQSCRNASIRVWCQSFMRRLCSQLLKGASAHDGALDHQTASVVENDIIDRRKPKALTPMSTQADAYWGKHATEQLPSVSGV